ncbi:hypothetical protein BH11ARM2_BH11ARM2_25230 [soil metagenome]
MKKNLAIAAFLALGLTGAFAQQAGPGIQGGSGTPSVGHGDRKAAMQAAMKQLNLTADQQKKIEDLEKSHRDKMKAARKANKGDKTAWGEKAKALRKEHEDALKTILNKDQQKKFKELRKDIAKKYRGDHGDKKGNKPGV